MKYPKIKWNKSVPVFNSVAEYIPPKVPDDTHAYDAIRYLFPLEVINDIGIYVIVNDD